MVLSTTAPMVSTVVGPECNVRQATLDLIQQGPTPAPLLLLEADSSGAFTSVGLQRVPALTQTTPSMSTAQPRPWATVRGIRPALPLPPFGFTTASSSTKAIVLGKHRGRGVRLSPHFRTGRAAGYGIFTTAADNGPREACDPWHTVHRGGSGGGHQVQLWYERGTAHSRATFFHITCNLAHRPAYRGP